jgi:penicillin-binding protein 2
MIDRPDRPPDIGRARIFGIVILLGLLAILARLWYLQVAHGEELEQQSRSNQRRLIRRVPPRGQITDCRGRVLATNRRQIVVSVVPELVLPDRKKNNGEVLPLLASLLNMPAEDLKALIRDNQINAFDPVRVAEDVDMATVTRIEEHRLDLPGVDVGPEPVRYYPSGPLCGHLLGQMGEIQKAELDARRGEGYRPGDYCGRLGLERAYDADLRGKNGGREIEVDARGRELNQVSNDDPIPGATLTLTIDLDIQKIAYSELSAWAAKGKPGAAVALDPQTGAVLAMVSVPSYDPNLFVKGISKADWQKIAENPLKPQINRAVGSGYAPGSTFKVVTATAGLETGEVGPRSRDYCSGVIWLGRWPKHCHKRGGHGSVDLYDAIAKSCDVFFYHLGQRLGPDRMAEYARRFGLGRRTGIDLPRVETAGIVPTPAWKRKRWHQEWVGGETVDYAIGQAMLACTPLQMCNVAAAIGNGGTLYQPQLVRAITAYDTPNTPRVIRRLQPKALGKLGVSPNTLAVLARGMREVMEPGGTGAASAIPGLAIAGKTGTAQMRQRGEMVNNAWFIGFAPVENPRIAVCVFVEGGGHGGAVAAPIARKMLAQFFHLKPGEPKATSSTD